MKYTKRFLSAILSITILLALSISVYAATNNGTPKDINAQTTGEESSPHLGGANFGNTTDNGSITIYKLDIAAYEAEKSQYYGYSVTYEGSNPTGAQLSETSVIGYIYSTSDVLKTKLEDVTLANLEALSNISFKIESVTLNAGAAAGSTSVSDYTADGSIISYALTEGGYISWTGLPKGYYRVTELDNSTAAAVGSTSYIISLPMVNPANDTETINDVYVYPKNRAKNGPEIEKEQPVKDDVNGNVITWNINADVPADIKATVGKQSYVITDTMGSGLKYVAGSLRVYYKYTSNGSTVEIDLTAADGTDDNDYSVTYESAAGQLVIKLNEGGFTKLADAIANSQIDTANGSYKLYITYKTIVSLTDDQWSDLLETKDPVTNKVHLDFTNDDGNNYEDDGDPVIYADFAALRIIKYDGATNKPTDVGQSGTTYLPGAKFKVYTALDSSVTPSVVNTNSALKDANGDDIELTIGLDGSITYNGLGAGTYYIVETATPSENYQALTGYDTVVISDNNVTGKDTLTTIIANYLNNGLTLPQTGGIGTYLFIGIGAALICTAAIILVISRKRNSAK